MDEPLPFSSRESAAQLSKRADRPPPRGITKQFDSESKTNLHMIIEKQRQELAALEFNWFLQNKDEIDITSHQMAIHDLDKRESVENLQQRMDYDRKTAISSLRRRQKKELEAFFTQRAEQKAKLCSSLEESATVPPTSRSYVSTPPHGRNSQLDFQQKTPRKKSIPIPIPKRPETSGADKIQAEVRKGFFLVGGKRATIGDNGVMMGKFKPKGAKEWQQNEDLLNSGVLSVKLSDPKYSFQVRHFEDPNTKADFVQFSND